ncbi:MAG: DJ-1/PfpI family protein [Treponema sp.]|jgi:4-methyl-5(b-hydroxyethyl)-thiazole monophosphate biosynthesis|nr:DJ-1/PfpI family protein [Treponema sp.]
MDKKALIFLADGFEEVEAVTPVDYLRRAGIKVVMAAIGKDAAVMGSHGISFTADTTLEAMEKQGELDPNGWDCVIIPGGMLGSKNLAACAPVGNFLKKMATVGKTTAAICAAPAVVLAPLGLLEGKRFTCYPEMEKGLKSGTWAEDKVVIDGTLITSRAAGTAAEFAFALIRILAGGEQENKLRAALLL